VFELGEACDGDSGWVMGLKLLLHATPIPLRLSQLALFLKSLVCDL